MCRVVFGIILCALCSTSAWATNYTYSTTIDLSSATYATPGSVTDVDFILPSGQPSFQLNSGDTLSGTVNFNGSLSFTGPAPSDAVAFSITTPGPRFAFGTASGSFELLGVTGQLSIPNPEVLSINHFSDDSTLPIFYFTNLVHDGIAQTTPISFTGFAYSLTIFSPSGSYSPEGLAIDDPNGNLSITIAPEPQTWGLLLGGLISLILLGRKRTAAYGVVR